MFGWINTHFERLCAEARLLLRSPLGRYACVIEAWDRVLTVHPPALLLDHYSEITAPRVWNGIVCENPVAKTGEANLIVLRWFAP